MVPHIASTLGEPASEPFELGDLELPPAGDVRHLRELAAEGPCRIDADAGGDELRPRFGKIDRRVGRACRDRKSVGWGKRVARRVNLGGRRILKNNKNTNTEQK